MLHLLLFWVTDRFCLWFLFILMHSVKLLIYFVIRMTTRLTSYVHLVQILFVLFWMINLMSIWFILNTTFLRFCLECIRNLLAILLTQWSRQSIMFWRYFFNWFITSMAGFLKLIWVYKFFNTIYCEVIVFQTVGLCILRFCFQLKTQFLL